MQINRQARLMNGYYSSMYEVMYDINAIWTACFSFNSVKPCFVINASQTKKSISVP